MVLFLLKKAIFFCHAQCGVFSKVFKTILNGKSHDICENRWSCFFCFFDAFDLINDGIHSFIHCSLFLQNIIDGADKIVSGERVAFCNLHYRLIRYWYCGNVFVLLFPLSESTYKVNYFSWILDVLYRLRASVRTMFDWRDYARFVTVPISFYADIFPYNFMLSNTW